jgi:hypothetical protein
MAAKGSDELAYVAAHPFARRLFARIDQSAAWGVSVGETKRSARPFLDEVIQRFECEIST